MLLYIHLPRIISHVLIYTVPNIGNISLEQLLLSISTFSTRSDKILEVTSFINYRSLPSTMNNVLYWQNIENISGRKIYFFITISVSELTLYILTCAVAKY